MSAARTLVQLTRRGAVWNDDGTGRERLAEEFSERHCARLPALLEPFLLSSIQREIERGSFRERAHGAIATELCLQVNACTGLLQFLVNDPGIYRLVEDLSGCRPIRFFNGRVYRMRPGHYDTWHNDLVDDRLVGMSINLSTEAYQGGVFTIRDAGTERVLAAVANVGFGDAILFRISETLEHCVTGVEGTRPKTAYAGWFYAGPDYLATVRAAPQRT